MKRRVSGSRERAPQRGDCRNCDGDWEHAYGIPIGTFDNPGWRLSVDIEEADAADAIRAVAVEHSPDDWYHCFLRDGKFEGIRARICDAHLLMIVPRRITQCIADATLPTAYQYWPTE